MQKKKLYQKFYMLNVERCFLITQILPPCVFMEFLFLQSGVCGQKSRMECGPTLFSLLNSPF